MSLDVLLELLGGGVLLEGDLGTNHQPVERVDHRNVRNER